MGSIREIKSDIQVFEVRHDDLAGKFSEADVAQGVLNIIKNKHHHPDGTPVQLHVVNQTGRPNLTDAAFRENLRHPTKQQEEPQRRSGIDAIAAQASAWGAAPKQNVAVGSSAYSGGAGGGSADTYKAGSSVSGFNIQCNCGMEFTGAAHKDSDMMVTGNKYNASKEDSAAPQYKSSDGGDWGEGLYQTGGAEVGDSAYQSDANYH